MGKFGALPQLPEGWLPGEKPRPSADLTPDERKHFFLLVREIRKVGPTSTGDGEAISTYCKMGTKVSAIEKFIASRGIERSLAAGDKFGREIEKAIRLAGCLNRQMLDFQSAFGLTPAARRRAGVTIPTVQDMREVEFNAGGTGPEIISGVDAEETEAQNG